MGNKLYLKTIEVEGKEIVVTESRVVAENTDTRHTDLLRKIRGYEEVLLNAKLRSADFFIEDSYKDSTGKENKCYQLTKEGCEMVANKMTGKKGILFTATYVKAFNDMQEQLKSGQSNFATKEDMFIYQLQELKKTKQQLNEVNHRALEAKDKAERLDEKVDKKFDELPLFKVDSKSLSKLANKKVSALLGGKGTTAYKTLSKKAWSDLYGQIHREFQVQSIDEIKRKNLEQAKQVIMDYKLPSALREQVEIANNQIEFEEAN